MAFLSSTSAFGMKPATTSLFGNSQQPQSSTSTSTFSTTAPAGTQNSNLFGAFGQNQQQNQQQPSTGLFGQPAQQQQQQQPSTGLFGQQTQQQNQQPSSGLFGQPAQQQNQQPSTGLFGQSTQQQNQQPSTGLFGQSTQQQNQQQPSNGLFGQQPQQQQPQQGSFGGSLFGNTTNQPQQQNTFGNFGNFGTTAQQPSLFGNAPTANNLGLTQPQPGGFNLAGGFGSSTNNSSLFGNKPAQTPQPQQPSGFSGASGPPPFVKSTKFNDLPDDVKRAFEVIDSHIQGRILISKELHQRKLGEEPMKLQELIRNAHKDTVNTSSTVRSDLQFTHDLKAKVDQAVQDTIVATRIVDGFRNPQSGNTYLNDHASFPLEFFTRITEQMRERLTWYKNTIEQIERKIASSTGQARTPSGISTTLQAQHAIFISLANKTATLDSELQNIKAIYTQLWRSKTGSVRDPFSDFDNSADEKNGDLSLKNMALR